MVLVVDDDAQIRKAWHALLEAWGVEVHSAADGTAAEQLLSKGLRPQIIFCDLRLPGKEDGLQLLERWQVSHPEAHAVLLTGDRNSEALACAEEAGYLLLAKPMDPSGRRPGRHAAQAGARPLRDRADGPDAGPATRPALQRQRPRT